MAIGRIAGLGDHDAVDRLEQREKSENESGRRSRRHHDARGIDARAVALGIVAGKARAQGGDAERLGVAEAASFERGPCRRDRRRRCWRRGLAHLHVHDVASRLLDARRRRHHIHHHEGRHVAAAGWHKQRLGGGDRGGFQRLCFIHFHYWFHYWFSWRARPFSALFLAR